MDFVSGIVVAGIVWLVRNEFPFSQDMLPNLGGLTWSSFVFSVFYPFCKKIDELCEGEKVQKNSEKLVARLRFQIYGQSISLCEEEFVLHLLENQPFGGLLLGTQTIQV